jgi:hypothetical protein
MKRSSWLLVAAASAALFPGCAGKPVTKVLVTLTLDKAPLTDATVKLLPKDDPSLGDGCEGITASDGKVELVPNPKKRLKAGRYVVLVKKLVSKDGSPFKLDEDIAVRSSSGDWTFGAQNLVPAAYNDRERALLIATLTGGENEVTFDLDRKKK